AYDGDSEINIKIASAHGDNINNGYLGFEGNDGRYTLVGDGRDYLTQGFSDDNEENTFAKGFYMHKDVTRKTLNAKLTKLSSNNVSAGTDTLTFNYSVTSID
ncbi:hypothetical protein, partial [Enterococcus faecium]|uniref:hypothetical protein n=1 Tax=Enterococcus faecium TaxID=1352 RepID=UPI00248ABDB3